MAITAGPWLLRLDHEQVVVGWATSAIADGTLECWAVDEPHRARAHHPHRVTAHHLRVTGLRPATAYHYRIRSGRAKSPILAFTTLPAKLEKLTFAVYGGASHDLEQHAEIAKAIAQADPAFVVYAGGYTKLAPDAEMADEAAVRVRSLEPAAELLSSHALVPAAGSLMWGRTFTRLFPTRTGAPWYSYRLSLVEVFVLDPAAGLAAGGEQLEWLRNALRRSAAWWKFVVFHLPSLSGNPIIAHGDLRRALLPLLLRGGVDAVITGAAPRERSVPIRLASEPGGHALVSAWPRSRGDMRSCASRPRRPPRSADSGRCRGWPAGRPTPTSSSSKWMPRR